METKRKTHVDVVVGTRPEAIKMAPVILEMRKRPDFSVRVIATGQHTDMLRQALDFFALQPDIDLQIMKDRQTLDHITSSVLQGTGSVFDERRPDVVLVHGDTTTTFASALAAFYRGIPIGHVEAGLRSHNLRMPFPEEMNRLVADRLATWWFAPTDAARENLLREDIGPGGISVTGNTVIDALFAARERVAQPRETCLARLTGGEPFILLTAHRRESWGEPLARICAALSTLLERYADFFALVPMHKNPAVRAVIRDVLGKNDRVILCEPLDYPDFVWALDHCRLILSDSGGVQEEASALAKPVLILRDVTERPEALLAGSGILVGTDQNRIFTEADDLLSHPAKIGAIREKCRSNAFGDGRASIRIADILSQSMQNG